MEMQASRVWEDLHNSTAKVKMLEGGSRSTKTWSVIQEFILYCQANRYKSLTVCRAKLTWLKATALKDFITVLKMYGYYNAKDHNKTDNIIHLWSNEVAFIGLDETQKLHGRSQDRAWINEATDARREDFDQLEMRTSQDIILDYNPITTDSWIFENVEPRDDSELIHSTQLDNPFLPDTIRKKILSYEPTPQNIAQGTDDEYNWQVYGLGLRADVSGLIYTNTRIVDALPEGGKRLGYWIDFGFTNHPTSIGELWEAEGELWAHEHVYQTDLTNQDIYEKAVELELDMTDTAVADSAEPKSIEEIRRMGWYVEEAIKGPDSINNGIDIVKRYRLNITKDSFGLIKESKNYRWKKDRATGNMLNKPVDAYNHSMDGIRYVALNEIGHGASGEYDVR